MKKKYTLILINIEVTKENELDIYNYINDNCYEL